jgi:hypothetical protein
VKDPKPSSLRADILRIPDGWTLEPFERQPDYAQLSTLSPRRYMATIDFRARGIRSGYNTRGRFVDEEWNKPRKRPNGRGWKQSLVDEAIAHLQELLNHDADRRSTSAPPLDPAVRSREKQASRDADTCTVASGEKSRNQLKVENGAFAFPRDRIRLELPPKPPKR